jgi:hypothetical protein
MDDMRIVLAGASGFLGTALGRHFEEAGHDVVRLVRREPTGPDERSWDPATGQLDPTDLAGSAAIINIGGAPIDHWPWTASHKRKIRESRLETTRTIAGTIAGLEEPPALLNGSGVHFYGADRGDEQLDEESGTGPGFLAEVSRDWEAATRPAAAAGARVAILRTSPVLHSSGGVLKLAKLPFLLGVGGRLGSGNQFFPSIAMVDYLAAVTRLATDSTLAGPYNLVAPVPATNAEFTRAMGRRLRRPTVVPVPGFVMKGVAGEQAQLVLGSLRVTPKRLLEAGFEFRHPTIEAEVDAAFS